MKIFKVTTTNSQDFLIRAELQTLSESGVLTLFGATENVVVEDPMTGRRHIGSSTRPVLAVFRDWGHYTITEEEKPNDHARA